MSEESLQIACVNWFRYQYPEPKYLIFAVPNGGKRNIITAVKMKKQGVRAGIPDLCIMTQGKMFFIEMKIGKNQLTENQIEIISMINDFGFKTYVARSFEEFEKICNLELQNKQL